jgi:hypothetical protein
MINRYADGEPAAELLERRWFAALRAAKSAQAECEVMLEVVELAQEACRRTRSKLTELETLRDALGEQLAALDGPRSESLDRAHPAVMSAA